MHLLLTDEQIQAMQRHTERSYPEEGCGVLLGTRAGDTKSVVEVRETENAWNEAEADIFREVAGESELFSKRRRFSIAPEVLLQLHQEARDRQLEIVGIFHSHPDAPARPSDFDRAIAWPIYSYIILSVRAGKTEDIQSWKLDDDGQFQAEVLSIYN